MLLVPLGLAVVVKVQLKRVQVVVSVWPVRQLLSEPVSWRPTTKSVILLLSTLAYRDRVYWVLGSSWMLNLAPSLAAVVVTTSSDWLPYRAWLVWFLIDVVLPFLAQPLTLPSTLVVPFSKLALPIKLTVLILSKLTPPVFWTWKMLVEPWTFL